MLVELADSARPAASCGLHIPCLAWPVLAISVAGDDWLVEALAVLALLATPVRSQHVAGFDVYDAGSVAVAVLAGVLLAVRVGLRLAGQGGVRSRPLGPRVGNR